ncbi:MAG TPA: hypothetical protein VGM63_12340 [Mucilaginibacter sp.]|jgi:hypothetical protein
MKEKIELNRVREFGDIISDTFVIFRQNFVPLLKSFFVICGLFIVANTFISAVVNNTRQGDFSLHMHWLFLSIVFGIVYHTAFVVTIFSYLAIYKEKGNQPAELLEVWGYFKYYYFRVFLTQIVLIVGALIGFFVCFFPGVYLSIVFALVTPVMIFENGSIEYSFKRAFKVIKENWWFTFGTLLLMTIVILLCMLAVLVPPAIFYGSAQWLLGLSPDNTAGVLQAVLINLCQVLWIVPMIALTLIYYTLTEEKEGNTLIERINMFGKNKPGADQPSSEQY